MTRRLAARHKRRQEQRQIVINGGGALLAPAELVRRFPSRSTYDLAPGSLGLAREG